MELAEVVYDTEDESSAGISSGTERNQHLANQTIVHAGACETRYGAASGVELSSVLVTIRRTEGQMW